MVFSEIPAGSSFLFGSIMNRQPNYGTRNRNGGVQVDIVKKPMVWKKTMLDGLSVGVEEMGIASFDYPHEATGQNKYVRTHGHRMFFLSSLYKFLNCSDSSWQRVAEGDARPYVDYERTSGFLSRFSDEERSFLMPFSMTTETPTGYTKQYGQSQTKEVLVGIPSASQIGTHRNAGEFGVVFDRSETWVTDVGTMQMYNSYGSTYRIAGERGRKIMPVIKINPDAPVDRDERGRFIIRVPETEFDGDLCAFLGFEAVA